MVKVALIMMSEEEAEIIISALYRSLRDENYVNESMKDADKRIIFKLENLKYEGTLL